MLTPEQQTGLQAAYTRKQQGTANPTDIANLDYAQKNLGWKPPVPSSSTTNPVVAKQEQQNLQGIPAGYHYDPRSGALAPDNEPSGVDLKESTTATPTETPADTTQTTATTQKEAEPVDMGSSILAALNKGYSTAQEIATATGLKLDEVNNYIKSDYKYTNLLQNNQLINQEDKAFAEYQKKISDVNSGNFTLTEAEQSQIDSIQKMFDQMKEEQLVANQNYEEAVQTGEIRSGRQEFMNAISSGIYKQAVDDGIAKINDLDQKAIETVTSLKELFKQNKYKEVTKAYEDLTKYLDGKKTAIKNLYTTTKDIFDDAYKKQQDAVMNDLKFAELDLKTAEYLLNNTKFDYQQKQDAIKNLLENDKFTWQQKQDLIKNQLEKNKFEYEQSNDARYYELNLQKYLLDIKKASASDTPENYKEWQNSGGFASGKTYEEFLLNKGSQKPATIDQQKNAEYANSMKEANNNISLLTDSFKKQGLLSQLIGWNAPSYLLSPEQQRLRQAEEQFINAILRRESGAAVTENEYKRYASTYLPVPGDEEDVLKAKETARVNRLRSLVSSAGAALSSDFIDNLENINYSSLQDYIYLNPDKADYIQYTLQPYAQSQGWEPDETLQYLLDEEAYDTSNFNSVGSDTEPISYSSITIPQSSKLAYVNNNPGNLRYIGQTGATEGKGGFAKFSSPEAGWQALIGDIKAKQEPGGKLGPDSTLKDLVYMYAPPAENDSETYVKNLASALGVSPTTKIGSINTQKLAKSIAKLESSTIIG